MKKLLPVFFLLFLLFPLAADSDEDEENRCGMGDSIKVGVIYSGNFEKNGPADSEELGKELELCDTEPQLENSLGGVYLELTGDNLGIGLSFLADLNKLKAAGSSIEAFKMGAGLGLLEEEQFDFMSTVELKYHLFGGDAFFDLFGELVAGVGGSFQITPAAIVVDEESSESCFNDNIDDPNFNLVVTRLSAFGAIGAGMNLNFGEFHVGAKVNYYIKRPEGALWHFAPYDFKTCKASIYAGFTF